MRRITAHFCVLLATLGAAACGGSAPRGATAVAPTLAVEGFLRAANQNDLDTMASLFGTREGSVTREWSREEVDRRMFLLASMLRHTDYRIGEEQIVPGRRDEATQYLVHMTVNGRAAIVPFTLVRSREGSWLVENICTNRITMGEHAAC